MRKPKNNLKNFKLVIDFATYNEGMAQGIEMVAGFVEDFDKYINHEWRLSDCIRSKFGRLPKNKIRRNTRAHVMVGIWNKPRR